MGLAIQFPVIKRRY